MGSSDDRALAETAAIPAPATHGPPTADGSDTTGGGVSPDRARPAVIANRYEILGLLGTGGMGNVYRVRDRELDEVVALKTLRREWIDSPGALERFRREVKLARRITHRNVARTFDLGETDGEKFLTMELVEGRSLAAALDDGALPLDEVRRVGVGIAEALEAAHAADVIHRDLKPDNVLLETGGRVVVTDFGIARARLSEGSASTTGAGAIVGTPAYMAPEQVEGLALDPRADLYALGLVLYETITGRRAFSGETPLAVAAARLVRPPPVPVRDGLPAELRDLVVVLLSRRPEDRPSSAAEVRARLAAAPTPSAASVPAPVLAAATRSLVVADLAAGLSEGDRWIGEGLVDDLSDGLCMVRALRVRGRSATIEGEDARDFGARMGVDLVVGGAVRRSAESVRVTLRLTTTADGYQIWAGRYDGALGELLRIADQAAGDIARAAGVAGPDAAPRSTIDPRAIELHARARRLVAGSFLDRVGGRPEVEAALALAPDEPRFLATLATICVREGFRVGADVRPLLEEARAAAERANALAPDLPEPLVALAQVRMGLGETPAAAAAARRALREGPSVGAAHETAGRILSEADRLEDARTLLLRALWLDELLNLAYVDLARVLALLGKRDEAMAQLDRLGRMNPQQRLVVGLRLGLWWGERGSTELPAGMSSTPFVHHYLGLHRALAAGAPLPPADVAVIVGRRDQLLAGSRVRRFIDQQLAEIWVAAGDPDRGLGEIELAVGDGLEDIAWLGRCPLFRRFDGDPRFEAARRTVAARSAAIASAWDAA